MKRFTETDKWRDPWFRKLTTNAKLFWFWLCDNCDKAGVIDLDFEIASFDIGETINEKHVAEIQSRIQQLATGKIHIPKFVPFQNGKLSKACIPHAKVIELLESHGISYPVLTVLSTTIPPTLSHRVETTLKKKEEERGEEERGEEGGTGGRNGLPDSVFTRDLLAAYRRLPGSVLTYAEQSCLAEIIRERPRYADEWRIIQTLRDREPRYFPQSLSRLLTAWQETLDRANNSCEAKPTPSVFNLTKIIEAKRSQATDMFNQHAIETGLDTTWNDPRARDEYRGLKAEIKKLTKQLGGLAT